MGKLNIHSPEFDLMEFLKYSLFYKSEKKAVKSLLNDKNIFLAIIHSDYYDFISLHTFYIKEQTIKDIIKDGYEAWFKHTIHRNRWYGIILNDDLSFLFKLVNGNAGIKILKGENTANKSRKMFSTLKMAKVDGPDVDLTNFNLATSKMDLLRKKVNTDLLKSRHYYSSCLPTATSTKWRMTYAPSINKQLEIYNKEWWYKLPDLKLQIIGRSNHVAVDISALDGRNESIVLSYESQTFKKIDDNSLLSQAITKFVINRFNKLILNYLHNNLKIPRNDTKITSFFK